MMVFTGMWTLSRKGELTQVSPPVLLTGQLRFPFIW